MIVEASVTGIFRTILIIVGTLALLRFLGRIMIAKRNLEEERSILKAQRKQEKELEKICKYYKILPNEIAFIGDDVNDIKLMKKVGFSVTPSDGILQAKKIANHICKNSGGNGALREMIDLILKEKFANKTKWY